MLHFFNCSGRTVKVAAKNYSLHLSEVTVQQKQSSQFSADGSISTNSGIKLVANKGTDKSSVAKYEQAKLEFNDSEFKFVSAESNCRFEATLELPSTKAKEYTTWSLQVIDEDNKYIIESKSVVVAYYANGAFQSWVEETGLHCKSLYLINCGTLEYLVKGVSSSSAKKPVAKVGSRIDKIIMLKLNASDDGKDVSIKVGDRVRLKIFDEEEFDIVTTDKKSGLFKLLEKATDCFDSSSALYKVSFTNRSSKPDSEMRQTWKISKHPGHANSPGDEIRVGDWITLQNCATDGYLKRHNDKKKRRLYTDESIDGSTAWILSVSGGKYSLECGFWHEGNFQESASLASDDSDCTDEC